MRQRWAAALRERRDALLLGGAALALAACLLDPSLPWQSRLPELFVVLDITQSMNTVDQLQDGKAVPRLVAAKRALHEAMAQLPCGSRVGLGVFTQHRSLMLLAPVEVCAHLDELRDALAGIDNRMAWIGASEIAKAIYNGMSVARQLPRPAALVFITDGHESPPLNPRHRPRFDLEPGQVPGLIVGVGGETLQPIPKTDPQGRPLGAWSADDVLQVDPRSLGRGGTVGGERMVETEPDDGSAAALPLGATPGNEHLSSLRSSYLELLAAETGLGWHRLEGSAALAAALRSPALAQPVPARADLRPALALLALALLLARLWPAGGLAALRRWMGR